MPISQTKILVPSQIKARKHTRKTIVQNILASYDDLNVATAGYIKRTRLVYHPTMRSKARYMVRDLSMYSTNDMGKASHAIRGARD
jgi:hypothetical protein